MRKNFVILLIFILILNPVFLPQISSNSNVTGNGITIAIIDTGIDYNHPGYMCRDDKVTIYYLILLILLQFYNKT